jgi:VWFA-related protein
LLFRSEFPTRYISKTSCSLSLIALFALVATPLHAQDPEATGAQGPRTTTITVNARLVVLDVVVTGKDGKPVDGLTRKDFQVFEDGKSQSIRSFEPPSAHSLPAESSSASAATVFDPAKPAAFGQSPVTILVLDQLNTHFADSSFARRALRDYLTKQPQLLTQPTTLLTVFDNRFKLLQGFTRDRDALLKALEAAPTEYAWKLEVNGNTEDGPIERIDQSLRALEQIAQSYARIAGRKNLVWVGGGFPTLDPASIDGADAQEVKDTLQHVTDVLLDTRITLYAVDPSSSAAGLTEITDTTQLEVAEATGGGIPGSSDPFNSSEDFDKLGPVTGGRVVRGRNDIPELIASSVDLGASYYTIGYAPSSSSQAEGKYRKIRVVCLVPDLTVNTRNGYYPQHTQQEKSGDTMSYDLTTAAESTIPLNGLHVTVEPNHSVASAEETYIVHVGAAGLTWQGEGDGSSSSHVEVMAASLSPKGKLLGHTLHGMVAKARADVNLRDSSRNADFDFTVKPVAKATILRFVVRDAGTGRMGSVDLPLPGH